MLCDQLNLLVAFFNTAGDTRRPSSPLRLPTSCLPDRKWRLRNYLHRRYVLYTAIEHDGVNNVAVVPDARLLQPTRQAEATLRGSPGTDHHQDLDIIHWIAPDAVRQNRRQVRVGWLVGWSRDSPTLKHEHQVVGLRAAVKAGGTVPDSIRPWTQHRPRCSTRYEVRPKHCCQKAPARPSNGLT
jgi:hypothetical protein